MLKINPTGRVIGSMAKDEEAKTPVLLAMDAKVVGADVQVTINVVFQSVPLERPVFPGFLYLASTGVDVEFEIINGAITSHQRGTSVTVTHAHTQTKERKGSVKINPKVKAAKEVEVELGEIGYEPSRSEEGKIEYTDVPTPPHKNSSTSPESKRTKPAPPGSPPPANLRGHSKSKTFIGVILEPLGKHAEWVSVILIITAAIGIPVRLYLMTSSGFNYAGLSGKFLRLFPFVLVLDVIWTLGPFLLAPWIGMGLALASCAVLLYVPFAQRSLLLMGEK
jgi:hypothetical protein